MTPGDCAAERSSFLVGENLYLRGVRLSDANEAYLRWLQDPEVNRYLEARFFPPSPEGLREYVAGMQGSRENVFLAIVLNEGDRHIGNIKLGSIDWIHRFAEVGIMIGEKDCWGRGYAAEALRLLAGYAFDTLNLRKLTAGCYDANEGSIRAFQKAGFVIEGVRKEQFFCGGRYVDHVLLGLLRARGIST